MYIFLTSYVYLCNIKKFNFLNGYSVFKDCLNNASFYAFLTGFYSESSSNGFVVDDTPPSFKMPITHVRIGSVFPFTSVLRSTLKVKWDVEDKESYISQQHLSISANRADDFNISIKVWKSLK